MRLRYLAIGVPAIVLVSFAVACGGSDNTSKTSTAAVSSGATTASANSPSSPAAAATKAPVAASTARNDVDALKVTAQDFSFTLSLSSIRPGAPGVDVEFINNGPSTHSLAFYSDADFKTKIAESNPVASGSSSGFPFIPPDGAATVYYRCEIHPTQMKGELPVT